VSLAGGERSWDARRRLTDGRDRCLLRAVARPFQSRAGISALLALLAVLVAGCAGSPAASPPAEEPAPTDVAAPATSPGPFVCGAAVRRPGTVPLARITAIDVTNEAGLGRIVFTFRLEGDVAGVPEVLVRPAEPPFSEDPSGLPLEVPGLGFVSIVLFGGTAWDEDYQPTLEGPFDFDPAPPTPIVAFRRAGDFEAVSSYVGGLDGPPCARVLPPDGTGRLVIELARG
jgi:hypothetical protein